MSANSLHLRYHIINGTTGMTRQAPRADRVLGKGGGDVLDDRFRGWNRTRFSLRLKDTSRPSSCVSERLLTSRPDHKPALAAL